MSLASAVRAYLADKNATLDHDGATWNEEGREHALASIEGPLTADAIVDAHVRALARRATLTLIHTGAPTPVALRTAARFGITLIDAATLPQGDGGSTAAEPARAIETAWNEATLTFNGSPTGEASAVGHPSEFKLVEDIATAWSDALDAMDRRDARAPPPPLTISEEFPIAGAEAFAAMDALAVVTSGEASPDGHFGSSAPVDPPVIVAASEPDPMLAHADPALPWDLSLGVPEPEPVHVEPTELAAMPWNLQEDQHELLSAGRAARFAPARPTALSQDWGLPWPRPVVPTGGLAIADPRVWHAQERIEQVREDLQKVGAPSFGAVKPEGSAWLKRLNEFGAP